jgi:hypothetical protein
MSNYLISIPKSETLAAGTIHDSKSKLKVKAFDLPRSTYKPRKGEVRFFVTDGKKTLAFETEGYKKHRQVLILHMISWYCMYSGLLGAQIHSSLPGAA